MSTQITVKGLDEVLAILKPLPRELSRAAINTLNKGATAARKLIVDPAVSATGMRRAALNGQIPIQRATSRFLVSRVRPKSSGIPVPEYKWRHEEAGKWRNVTTPSGESYSVRNPTRHRILVNWPGGEKVAAGFVNPFGSYQAPISTRRYAYRGDTTTMTVALAPSAAALRKVLYRMPEEKTTQNFLMTEIEAQLVRLVAGRPAADE